MTREPQSSATARHFCSNLAPALSRESAQGTLAPSFGRWLRCARFTPTSSVSSIPPRIATGWRRPDHGDARSLARHSDCRLSAGILVDTKRRAVGVFHAGWRGTVKRIVEKGVGEMRRYFGSSAARSEGRHRPRRSQAAATRSARKFASNLNRSLITPRIIPRSGGVRPGPRKISPAFSDGARTRPQRIAEEDFSRFGRSQSPPTVGRRSPAKNIEASPLCTACRTDLLVFLSGRKRNYREDDGGGGNQRVT